jgi:hypothetical protein
MNECLLSLVLGLHMLFVLFVVLTPFFGTAYFLLMHLIIVPFMVAHWYVNDNTCVLTLIEQHLRKKIYGTSDPMDCFTYRLIAPVYDFKKNNQNMSGVIYTITIVLWLYTVTRLYRRYKQGKLACLYDLYV